MRRRVYESVSFVPSGLRSRGFAVVAQETGDIDRSTAGGQ